MSVVSSVYSAGTAEDESVDSSVTGWVVRGAIYGADG